MASIFPGFEYDVFISYRQKDNKYDGWVTEFVDNLKREIEATFKEDISVYFDTNPHDGLLETYDVDASLREKLKCLIFIPVISRTYCDPKSFAWEHEFKAFVKLASADQFGLKVKLPNGNVANRILPIQIHDIGDEDKILLEKELGGGLRAVEFIYKEPGVNRPLISEDDYKKNLNNTRYRNQINKLANAIEEIVRGLKHIHTMPPYDKAVRKDSTEENLHKDRRLGKKQSGTIIRKRLIAAAAILTVIILVLFLYPKMAGHGTLDKLRSSGQRISVAVLPFRNMTNDTSLNIWQDGIQFNLITSLSNSTDLKVRQAESINNLLQSKGVTDYTLISTAIARTISQNLDANVFIYGQINAAGGKIRISAQLINSKTEEAFKSFQFDGDSKLMLVLTDSLASVIRNFLAISALRKEIPIEFQTLMPNSIEAFKPFILGYKAFFNSENLSAIKLFSQSLEIDSSYVYAYIWLSLSYANQKLFDQAEKWCRKLYEKKDQLPFEYEVWANLLYARYHEKSVSEELKYARQLTEIDQGIPLNHWAVALPYLELHQYNNAIPELQTMLEIYKSWNTKPMNSGFYQALINAYNETGRFKEEKKLLKIATVDFPGDLKLIKCQIIYYFTLKDSLTANKFIEDYLSICKGNSVPEEVILNDLAEIYSLAGLPDKADANYRKALSVDPENPQLLYDLGNFLINSNKNPVEGLEFVSMALVKDPENYYYLDAKGWGLYKLGKFDEALRLLEKSDSLKPVYNHEIFVHVQEVRKALDNHK